MDKLAGGLGGLAGISKIRGQLMSDIAKQTQSVIQGGIADEDTCVNLAKRLFDFYDKDSSGNIEEFECGNFICDVYKQIGRNITPTDEDKNQLLTMLDLGGKKFIDLKDFERMMLKYLGPSV